MFSSINALWKVVGHKKIYGPYDRPPFPIIIDKPTVQDLFAASRFSDYFMFGSIYGTGVLWSYMISRPFPTILQRLIVYHGISHIFFVTAIAATVLIPYRRLTGYWENGLRWRKPEDKLNKFDSTSHFEKATGWSRFRIDN